MDINQPLLYAIFYVVTDKLATNLSEELTQAFDFFKSGRADSDDDGDDNYSFKKDFFRWFRNSV